MSDLITSTKNPKIKFILSLYKPAVRKRENLFLIEGKREFKLAKDAGYQFHSIFYCPSILTKGIEIPTTNLDTFATTPEVFGKIVYREKSDGILAIAYQKTDKLKDLKLGLNPLILVAESIEKPGNVGAILRTADSAGVDAVLLCNSVQDIFNPNIVRSSLGTLFTNRVVSCSSEEAVAWLKNSNIAIYTSALTASVSYHLVDYKRPSALVVGSEADGVTDIWQRESDSNVIIPMFGGADSMNVSAATAILLYEALRQRGFNDVK